MNFKYGRTFFFHLLIFLNVSYNVFVFYSDASARHMYEIYGTCDVPVSSTSVTPWTLRRRRRRNEAALLEQMGHILLTVTLLGPHAARYLLKTTAGT